MFALNSGSDISAILDGFIAPSRVLYRVARKNRCVELTLECPVFSISTVYSGSPDFEFRPQDRLS
jgi:hypothetical protein